MNRTDARSDDATGQVPGRTEDRPARRPRRLVGAAALAAGAVLTTLAVPAPASAHTAPASGPARSCANGTYTVVRGDGWSIIARKLGTTTRALVGANGATTSTVVHPGQTLCAPAGASGGSASSSTGGSTGSSTGGSSSGAASCGTGTYTIVRGDGWLLIAKKLGVTSQALLGANKATVNTPLYAGRTLCVPAGAQAPATAGSTPTATPVKTYTAAESEAIIRAAWPDDLEEEALRIARRESNLKNTAKNWCCYGLFQIHFNAHKSWLATIGVTSANQLLDPTVNANAAYTLYQRAGSFRPWAL